MKLKVNTKSHTLIKAIKDGDLVRHEDGSIGMVVNKELRKVFWLSNTTSGELFLSTEIKGDLERLPEGFSITITQD